jgi:hypothetical protein
MSSTQLEIDFEEKVDERMPINQVLLAALQEDDDWRLKYSDYIIRAYLDMDDTARRIVEDIFASFCGWGLSTIIIAHLKEIDPACVDVLQGSREEEITRLAREINIL